MNSGQASPALRILRQGLSPAQMVVRETSGASPTIELIDESVAKATKEFKP
jgi:hypothetical protein